MNLSAYVLKSYQQNSNAIVCWGHGYFMKDARGTGSKGAYYYNIALLFC